MSKNSIINNSFMHDGISIIDKFVSDIELKNLKEECEFLFSKKSSNGSLGSINISNNTSYLMMPVISVRSINLLEIALRIKEKIQEFDENFKTYENTNIDIIKKTKADILPWHTDNRKGMIRAIIYIYIDENKSGLFRYMKKTHKRDFVVDHHLNQEQALKYSKDVVTYDRPEGTLIFFDSFGFHGREKVHGKRISITFDFLPKNSDYPKTAIPFSSRNLTDNVIKNLSFFLNNSAKEYNHGGELYYRNPPIYISPIRNLLSKIFEKFIKTKSADSKNIKGQK